MSGRPTRKAAQQAKAATSSAKPARPPRKTAATKTTGEADSKSNDRATSLGGQGRRNVPDSGDHGEDGLVSGEPADTIRVEQSAYVGSPGGFSGTTARTSMNSNRGQGAAISKILVETLAPLDDAAVRMLDQLTPMANAPSAALTKIARNFQDSDRIVSRTLRDNRKRFRDARTVYGEQPYINVDQAVAETLALSEPDNFKRDLWRPDDIFFQANLAIAAEEVQLRRNNNGRYDLNLEKMERDFPEPFVRSITSSRTAESTSGTTSLAYETFEMALDIRIQFAVRKILSRQGTDAYSPESVLSDIFHQDATVRGWNIQGLRTKDLSKSQKTEITRASERIQSDIQKCQGPDESVDPQKLEQLHSTEEFVRRYLTWIRSRSAEIDAYLATVGKVVGVQEAIEEFLERHNPDAQTTGLHSSSVPLPRDSLHEATEFSPARRAALENHLKKLPPGRKGKAWKRMLRSEQAATSTSPRTTPSKLSNLRQSTSASPSQPQTSRRGQPQTGAPGLPLSQLKSMASKIHQDQAEADKENAISANPSSSAVPHRGKSFIDAQTGAERIPFDTQAHDPHESLFIEQDDEILGEPSQDTGFEQDVRVASNKRSAPTAHERSGGKRVRIALAAQTQPISSDARIPESSAQAAEYIEANQAAKARTLVHSSQRPAQRRIPWTHDETTCLHDAIAELGTSWARIKQNDTAGEKRLLGRDQVALKDKARNLLFDYLKAGQHLPLNFDKIALNASQKNQLRGLRITLPEDFPGEQ